MDIHGESGWVRASSAAVPEHQSRLPYERDLLVDLVRGRQSMGHSINSSKIKHIININDSITNNNICNGNNITTNKSMATLTIITVASSTTAKQ